MGERKTAGGNSLGGTCFIGLLIEECGNSCSDCFEKLEDNGENGDGLHVIHELLPADEAEDLIEQIKITIAMYVGMKNGRVFHHSVSDGIVIYFLERIAEEEGKEGIELALNAVYGYAGFKYSVGSEMPELEKACDILREKYGLSSTKKE